MNFYTADQHFGHRNVIEYDNRPFSSVGHMDVSLINNWNAKVGVKDSVYIVGDLGMCNVKYLLRILSDLAGYKYLLVGNHDRSFLKKEEFVKVFQGVYDLKEIVDGNQRIVLCHYPMRSWYGKERGSMHFYGHVHNNYDSNPFIWTGASGGVAVNVGCMVWDYAPTTLEEIKQRRDLLERMRVSGERIGSGWEGIRRSCCQKFGGDIDDADS